MRCYLCDTVKDKSEFWVNTGYCKTCAPAYKKELRERKKDPNFKAKSKRKYEYTDQRQYHMCLRAKKRATERNLPFNILPKDISIPMHCPVLHIPIELSEDNITKDGTASLDRIIPELGYVIGNVVVISQKANRIKNEATLAEMELVTYWLKTVLEEIQ